MFLCIFFDLLHCAREVDDAYDDENINQQKFVSFLPRDAMLARY